jgi:alkylated DNA repair protein (DNA oxidative demethylase)
MIGPDGFRHLPGYLGLGRQAMLLDEIRGVIEAAPLFAPAMPRTGKPFSVRMTNCGRLGWVSDRSGGYRYQSTHPLTGRPWPEMPAILLGIWDEAAVRHSPRLV